MVATVSASFWLNPSKKIIMSKIFVSSLLCVLLFVSAACAQSEEHSYEAKNGYVPDEATALKIAEAVLIPIYGEKTITEEKPFKAELKDGVWVAEGTLNCPEGENCKGGVVVIEISKDNGKILRVSHGK